MCVFIIVTCVDHGKFIRLEGDYEEKIIYSHGICSYCIFHVSRSGIC